MLLVVDGRPISLMTFTVRECLIAKIRSFADAGRLAQIVPSGAV